MKILFLATDDYAFWLHRLPVARAARKEGAEVVVMTRLGQYCSHLEQEGFRVIPWSISRRSLNPLREFFSLFQVFNVYRLERPNLVHHFTFKPIIYGGLAARLCGGIPALNSVSGLGYTFTNPRLAMLFLRRLVSMILWWIFGAANCRVTFENDDDRDLLLKEAARGVENTFVIPGVGVDTEQFSPSPEPNGVPVVTLPARMLWEKGLSEFVAAAGELRNMGISARFALVGAPDLENPGCVPESQLRAWADAGVVEWWGQQTDMPGVLRRSLVICLPSYREGFPRALAEAAACGRAIVTTSAPGCRHVVRHGENGLLVPIKEPRALAKAICCLIENHELRKQMGAAGRARAVSEFATEKIVYRTLEVYRELLDGEWPTSGELSTAEETRTEA